MTDFEQYFIDNNFVTIPCRYGDEKFFFRAEIHGLSNKHTFLNVFDLWQLTNFNRNSDMEQFVKWIDEIYRILFQNNENILYIWCNDLTNKLPTILMPHTLKFMGKYNGYGMYNNNLQRIDLG